MAIETTGNGEFNARDARRIASRSENPYISRFVCEIRVGSFLFFEMNVLLLLLGTAEICLACFMYYQEFMLPEVKACREREAKRRAERLMRQAERDVRKERALYDK